MLKSLDVLIGLVVVLLALSMAVTVITQSITTMLNSRGKHLRRGLMDLLKLLDPQLEGEASKQIATAVLTHPLVSGSRVLTSGRMRLGNVIHREELTKLLIGLTLDQPGVAVDEGAKRTLKAVLQRNGVVDPDQTLKTIRSLALELEAKNPSLSNTVRQEIAILNGARSDFVAKINTWFDQTIDRTSQRFTASTRVITFAGALVVAVGLQVDTVSVVNRLAADDQMRAAFVAQGTAMVKDPATAPAVPDAELSRKYETFLAQYGVVKLPGSDWWTSFGSANFAGIFVTVLLLSLGAPFWYSILGKLLQLRSVLAFKDDEQRKARQDDGAAVPGGQTPTPATPTAATAIVAGERGDLTAVG